MRNIEGVRRGLHSLSTTEEAKQATVPPLIGPVRNCQSMSELVAGFLTLTGLHIVALSCSSLVPHIMKQLGPAEDTIWAASFPEACNTSKVLI
jgi:hypothetical protein